MESQVNPELVGLNVEYRVREVKRFIVTRYEHEVFDSGMETGSTGSQQLTGEYPNWDTAYAVGYALCKAEHDRLGYGVGDVRIQYPVETPPGTELVMDPNHHSAEEIRAAGRCFVNSEGEIESLHENDVVDGTFVHP